MNGVNNFLWIIFLVAGPLGEHPDPNMSEGYVSVPTTTSIVELTSVLDECMGCLQCGHQACHEVTEGGLTIYSPSSGGGEHPGPHACICQGGCTSHGACGEEITQDFEDNASSDDRRALLDAISDAIAKSDENALLATIRLHRDWIELPSTRHAIEIKSECPGTLVAAFALSSSLRAKLMEEAM